MLIWLKNQGKVRYRTFQLRSLSAASRRLALVLDERPTHAGRLSGARQLQATGIEVKYSVEVVDPDAAAALVQDIESVDADALAQTAEVRLQERFGNAIAVDGATVSTPRAVEYQRTTGEMPASGEAPVEEGASWSLAKKRLTLS